MKPTDEQLEALAQRDPALGAAMGKVTPFPGFPTPDRARGSHFQAIARSIVFQQLAGNAARAIYSRACSLTGGSTFPNAEQCLRIDEEEFKAKGLSTAKTRAIKDLAAKCQDGTVSLRGVSRKSDAEIVAMLSQVWGIGEWTAQMFLLFRLGRLDIMPAGDLAVREGTRILDGLPERPSPKHVLERAEVWSPLRSVATWVLYRLTDTEL